MSMSCATWETRGKRSGRIKEKEASSLMDEDEIDSGSEDAVAISRSSARYVSRVIAKFDDKKKALVEEIGFGGILHIPRLNKVNRKFSLWLLNRIDVDREALLLRDDVELPLTAANLNMAVGIPSGSRKVCRLAAIDEKDFVQGCLGIENGSADGLKEATTLVEKDYPDGMLLGDEMVFKSAFVIFIMGHFLAPTTQHNVGMTDFLGSVTEVDEIVEYNWCEYVLHHLLSSTKRAQAEIRSGKQLSYIAGCPLLVQFLYLDCIELGALNQPHDVFPRLRAFCTNDCPNKLLNQMIQCDTVSSSSHGGDQTFGCSKVRPLQSLCYEISVRPKNTATYAEQRAGAQQHCGNIDMHAYALSGAHSLANFLKEKYGDQLTTDLVDNLKVHNARCLQHFSKMKASLLQENIILADKILSNVLSKGKAGGVKMHKRSNRDDYLSGPESGSEDDNQIQQKRRVKYNSAPHDKQVPYTNKRSKTARFNRPIHGGKWYSGTTKTHHQIETLLTGPSMPMSFGDMNVAPADHIDSPEFPEYCAQPMAQSTPTQTNRLPSIREEYPSFELGIDLTAEPAEGLVRYNSSVVLARESTKQNGHEHEQEHPIQDSSFQTPIQESKNTSKTQTTSPASRTRNFCTAALCYKITEEEDGINLNKTPASEDFKNSLVKRSVRMGSGRLARSPWEVNIAPPKIEEDLSETLFDWLSNTTTVELARPWIMHQTTTYIEITGEMMKDHFCNGAAMTFDMFDAAIRRLRQLDSKMYPEGATIRWRHWFESNFAIHVLAGDDPTEVLSIKDQFIGKEVNYEIERCRMFIMPIQSKENWCAYMWDMKLKITYILDPESILQTVPETIAKHEKTIKVLHSGLICCIKSFFDGWNPDWENWDTNVPSYNCASSDKSDYGLCTLFLARNFNGEKYIKEPSEDNIVAFRKTLLYQLIALGGNKALPLAVYVQTIED